MTARRQHLLSHGTAGREILSARKGQVKQIAKDPIVTARRFATRRADRHAMATFIISQLPPWACRLQFKEGDTYGFECSTCGWYSPSLEFVHSDLLCSGAPEDAQQAASEMSRAQRVATISDIATVAKQQRQEQASQRKRERHRLLAKMHRQTLVC